MAEDIPPASTYCTSRGQGRYLESPVPLCKTLMIDKQVSKPADSRHAPYSSLHSLPPAHKCIKQFLEHSSWIAYGCIAHPLCHKLFNERANYTALGQPL